MEYTVFMRPGAEVDDALLASVRAALERVDGVSVTELDTQTALGANKRELVLTALLTYTVTVAANLSSAAIQARFQAALAESPETQGVLIDEVMADEDPPADGES